MLELFARHSLVDLAVGCTGDLHIDGHHTTEDVGICLGQAIDRALGDRAGIRRYGHADPADGRGAGDGGRRSGGKAILGLAGGHAVAQDRRVRQRTGGRFLACGLHAGADEPARDTAPRPQHAPYQRGRLQGIRSRLRDAVEIDPVAPAFRRPRERFDRPYSALRSSPTNHCRGTVSFS